MSTDSNQVTGDLPRIDQVNALIRHRRTIKPGNMSSREVSREHLLTILSNANWAPSHGITEPWRFRIYEGDSRRDLATALSAIYEAVTPEGEFLESKHTKLSTLPLKAPVVMVVWMKRQEIRKIPEIEEVEAVACAIQNMHLTASAIGLAAFWSSPKLIYTSEMNKWLNIEPDDKCLGLFYLGWPAEGLVWPERKPTPLDEKVVWMSRDERVIER